MNEIDKLPEVTLRALEPEDLELLYHIENDDKLWNVGITNVPYSRFMLQEYSADTRFGLSEEEKAFAGKRSIS